MDGKVSIKITDKIKKEILDQFVYESPNTSIFQTTEMAEVYRRNTGCTPLTLVAINEDTGEVEASLLAKILREKRGFLSSFSVHSTIRGGPIFLDTSESIEAASLLLQYYSKVEKNALYSRIYTLNHVPQIIPSFKESGYVHEDWQNFLIKLDKPLDDTWKQLKKSRRYGINKAKRKGVIIEEIKEKDLIPIFYNLLLETYKTRKALLEDVSNFEAAFEILVPKKMAKFLMAKYEGRYIAAMLILIYKGIIYDWYAGSSVKREDLLLCPNDLIVWESIKWGTENGYRIFDLGGGGKPSDNAGYIAFKRQFGGTCVNYGRYTKIHKPKKLKFSEMMFPVYTKLLKR